MSKSVIYIILFLLVELIFSQEKGSDSLLLKDYDTIETLLNNTESDSIKNRYANVYLSKAKIERDSVRIAEGYNFLITVHSHTISGLSYADSIIHLTKNWIDKKFPAEGYLQKGIQLYYLAKYNEALENYVIANEYLKTSNNDYQQLRVKHYIGLLKNEVNESDEALKLFVQNIAVFKNKDYIKKYKRQYLRSLFALADSYIRNRKLDSSEIINNIGIEESLKTDDKYLYPFFLLSQGSTKTLKKEYDEAIDSYLKGVKLLGDKRKELANTYLRISEVYDLKNEPKETIKYLTKIDSLYKVYPQVIFSARESYDSMLKHYRSRKDDKNQLLIINKLLKVDSIINTKHKDLSKQIIKKYETPELISEQEELINKLNKDNFVSKNVIKLLIILAFLLIFLSFYYIRRNFINKKRFNILIENYNEKASINKLENISSSTSLELPDDITRKILKNLQQFEESNKFINKNYTLNSLAKKLNTNSTYLSKIINDTKNLNFSNYLNYLKVDYVIKRLTKDKKFRSYTIKAIAEEGGFNSAQSFSNAFYKKTGIYPSYFVKKLDE